MNAGYNNDYMYETSCYDCSNCSYKNYQGGQFCQNACLKCKQIAPQVFLPSNSFVPFNMWYNPSKFPYGYYYGSYMLPSLQY